MTRKMRSQMVLNELTRRRVHPRGGHERRQAAKMLKMYARRNRRSAATALVKISKAKTGQ